MFEVIWLYWTHTRIIQFPSIL